MGTSTAQTLREIEETRGQLEADIHALEEKLPAPAVLGKRVVGIAAGGGAAGSVFWFVVRRKKRKRNAKRAMTNGTDIHLVPLQGSGGSSKLLVLLGIGGLIMRFISLRELRKIGDKVGAVRTVRPLP